MKRENSRKAPILMAWAAKARNAGVSMDEVSATLSRMQKKTVEEIRSWAKTVKV